MFLIEARLIILHLLYFIFDFSEALPDNLIFNLQCLFFDPCFLKNLGLSILILCALSIQQEAIKQKLEVLEEELGKSKNTTTQEHV